jgi:hypothetical protein
MNEPEGKKTTICHYFILTKANKGYLRLDPGSVNFSAGFYSIGMKLQSGITPLVALFRIMAMFIVQATGGTTIKTLHPS